jgi:hypothetical protein
MGMTTARAAVVALLAAAAVLIVLELGLGAASYGSGKLANPCHPRTFRGSGFDAAVQRIVLDGLSGAACRLHTSREELVLSIGSVPTGSGPHWDRHTIEVALRSGMLASLHASVRRGEIPGFLEPLLRQAIEKAPLDQLIRGGISLRGLIG